MSKRGRPTTDNPKVWFNVGIRTDLCRHIDQLATDAGITRTRLIELVLEKRYRGDTGRLSAKIRDRIA